MFLKTFISEFSYIEVWFTGKTYKLLKIEVKINIVLVIKVCNIKMTRYLAQPREIIFIKRLWIFVIC